MAWKEKYTPYAAGGKDKAGEYANWRNAKGKPGRETGRGAIERARRKAGIRQ
jgi:hypothetical protein